MARVDDRITRLRLFGPVYLDRKDNWLQSLCFWCRMPVQLQAFLPEIQPEVPEHPLEERENLGRI